ncbi:MAG TPA: arginine deiminase family protein [Methanobacterium sp.]|nr:MAG: amidinotransferase [Methanobacterium sp.]HOI71789.1 arginine deiminase family protein [Methanobacterium sp.]
MTVKIKAEWDRLKKVAVHTPGMEMFFGLLDPFASLYERAFSQRDALKEHEVLQYTLKHDFNVKVLPIKDTIVDISLKKPSMKVKLVELTKKSIQFNGTDQDVEMACQEMDANSNILDPEHYFNTILLNPSIELEPRMTTRMINLHITQREPLTNLYFMRDQQIITDKGMVLSRMNKPQRRREPQLTGLLWEMLKEPLIYKIQGPGTLEGGDYMPLDSFALLGMGDRTNQSGVDQLLEHGLGFDEVGVVHQSSHPLIPLDKRDPMLNMHLDNYFNVASKGVAVGSKQLLETTIVEIYQRTSDGYQKSAEKTNLYEYMVSKGFDFINITTLEQMAYASNLLCIRDRAILAVEVERIVKDVINKFRLRAKADPEGYSKLLAQIKKDYKYLRQEGQFFPHKKEIYQYDIDAYPLNLSNLTGGYGGAHCMTCPLKRI